MVGEQLLLSDISDQMAKEFPELVKRYGTDQLLPRGAAPLAPSELKAELREALIRRASEWALAACYLPCSVEMGVYLVRDPHGNLGAYITPAVFDGSIGPETLIWFEADSLRVVHEDRYHSPCRAHASEVGGSRGGRD